MKKSHATSGKTQVVFVRLDPLLQKLLNLVTQYREFVDNNNGEDDGMRLVESIKSLLEVLDELYEAIKQFGTTFSASLIVLADYVSLPLTSIFHINLEPTTAFDKETESEGSIRRQQIRRSYMHKLYLSTAKTIQCYVHACKEKQDSSTDEDPKDNQLHIPVTLNNKHLIQFLIALTNALPSDVEPGGKINTTHTNYLDDGSELCIVLLRTIETIVGVFKKDDNNLSDVWDGNLLARIVDCTASLSNNTPKQDLSLQCLQTLQTLLDATSSKLALWQSMFPGVFSSLYRRVISLHRQTSAGLSVSIECHALDILTELFRVTLSSLGTIHTSKKVKSATALLHQLESISRNQQRTVRGEMTPEEDSSTSFLGQVKKRVVAPLCLLLRQEAISPSEKVRMHVVSLCRVLLVDTRECWKGTNIQELSLEVCLIVEASPEGKIFTDRKQLFSDTMEHLKNFFVFHFIFQFPLDYMQLVPSKNSRIILMAWTYRGLYQEFFL